MWALLQQVPASGQCIDCKKPVCVIHCYEPVCERANSLTTLFSNLIRSDFRKFIMTSQDLTWFTLPKAIPETRTEVGAEEWVQVPGEHDPSMIHDVFKQKLTRVQVTFFKEIKVVDTAKAIKVKVGFGLFSSDSESNSYLIQRRWSSAAKTREYPKKTSPGCLASHMER